jgi:hypothetical protein
MVIRAVRVAIGRVAVSRRRQKSFPVEHAVNIANCLTTWFLPDTRESFCH